MTAEDLAADLNRLLREGLVYLEWDPDRPPRFGLTARGREVSSDDRLFRPSGRREVPPAGDAVREDIDQPVVTLRANTSSSSSSEASS